MKKTILSAIKTMFCIVVMLYSTTVVGQNETNNKLDQTLAPWLQVVGDTTLIPLLNTSAKVNIAGVIADVHISQTFHNTGKKPIEAIYVFPGSTRAAVYSMKMTIGTRTLIAKIEDKEKARKDYNEAKNQGKSASLLEQQRPNVFQMNVANILPGDTIIVEMTYTELLVPENGIYQFVYPTVVGPRYSNKTINNASENDKWVANPYTSENKKPTYTFDFAASISADIPLQDINCPTHKTNITFDGPSEANIKLDNSEKYSGNRDLILKYRLTGNTVQSGILLYKEKNENYFLAMIQPPKDVKTDEIPNREYIFIVDISGSMEGFPLTISKSILRKLIENLRPTDKFNVLLFAGGSTLMSKESVSASKENIEKAIDIIDNQQGGGGTELLPALNQALSIQKLAAYSRTFVVLTDGYVDVEKESFELIRNNLSNANFFAFGIGSSVNRLLIEGIAHVGQGESFVATNENEGEVQADKFREYIQNPLLTNIKITYNNFNVYDVTPSQVPDVFAQRPILLYGKWKGQPTGSITIEGLTGKGKWSNNMEITNSKCNDKNAAIKYLWARKKIEQLADYQKVEADSEIKKEITTLGLTYSLLTDYTSFIAIDSTIRTKDSSKTIVQPLPLPQGVSNLAIDEPNYSNFSMNASVNAAPPADLSSPSGAVKEMVIEEREEVFCVVEESATFQGGDVNGFVNWVNAHLIYPEEAAKLGIHGKVIVQFAIDSKGKICDIVVVRGIHPLLDAETIRVLKLSPRWSAAKQGGKSIKQQFTIPIIFNLTEEVKK